jgi:AcrR family transcriptional regulator
VSPRVRRDEVRRRLLAAAAEVFARRGYDAARLDEIAGVAGFTKGAVYSNFTGKHALLAALIEQYSREELAGSRVEVSDRARPDRAADELADVIARRTVEQGPWGRLVVQIAQRAAHDPEVRATYVGVRRALRDELATTLADGCARRGIPLAIPADRLALTLAALRMGLALEHGVDPEQVDHDTVADVYADTLRCVIGRQETSR